MSYDVVNTDTVHTATGMESVCIGHSTRLLRLAFLMQKIYIYFLICWVNQSSPNKFTVLNVKTQSSFSLQYPAQQTTCHL